MPELLRTPEQVLRETKRDLFFIRFNQWVPWEPARVPGKQTLFRWFKQHLPQVTLELLGPSEHSGFIEGGVGGTWRVDFDKASLDVYCRAWEKPDGTPKDPRWTCCIYPYARLRSKRPQPNRLE